MCIPSKKEIDMNKWQLSDIHHLGMTVSDIERSIAFYRDTLGMTLIGRRECVEADYVAKQTGYEGVRLSVASFRVRPDSPNSLEAVQYLNHAAEPVDTSTNRPGGTHLLACTRRPTRESRSLCVHFFRPVIDPKVSRKSANF